MTFSGRSFLDYGDIQPLRRPSSERQLELPLRSSQDVYREFFSEPANLREVIGESIATDERGEDRDSDELIRRARRSKRSIRENPNVLYELQRRLPSMNEIGQLGDTYALRQLFGEVPGAYGEQSLEAYGDRRGSEVRNQDDLTRAPERQVYYGAREGQVTDEMSPRQRTRVTPRSLRPSSLSRDVAILNVLGNEFPEFAENSEQFNELGDRVSRELRSYPDAFGFDSRIQLDEDADYENLRGLLSENRYGDIQVAGVSPGEFQQDVSSLLNETGSDPEYIMNYLQENEELPEDSQAPREYDWTDDLEDTGDYERIDQTPRETKYSLKRSYPEQEMLDSGVTATNQRISAEDFQKKYGNLQPREYSRDVNKRLAGVGGGRYLPAGTYERTSDKLKALRNTAIVPDEFESQISETFYDNDGNPYKVKINRKNVPFALSGNDTVNENVLQMLEQRPYAGAMEIEFSVNDEYASSQTPKEIRKDIQKFVSENALEGIPGGTLVRNSPTTPSRAAAYQRSGFGGNTLGGQYAYIDPESGDTVPIQPFPRRSNQPEANIGRMYDAMTPQGAALRGATNLLKENVKGSAVGALGTLLDPDMREAIESGDGRKAAETVARDIATGAVTEAALKGGASELAKRAPGVAAKALPVAAQAGRALATGGAIAPLLELGGSSRQTDAQRQAELANRERRLKAAEAARARGGKLKIGPFTLPELGISEAGGLFFR